jgi:hypothetical protein
MIGLRARDRVYRRKFTAIYHRYVSRSLFDRLHYVLGLQDWETLSDSYWLTQALDLMMSAINEQDLLRDASRTSILPPFDLSMASRKPVSNSTLPITPTRVEGKVTTKKEKSPLMRRVKPPAKKIPNIKMENGIPVATKKKRKHDGNALNGSGSAMKEEKLSISGSSDSKSSSSSSSPSSSSSSSTSTPSSAEARISLLRSHSLWVNQSSELRVESSIIMPLRELIHASPRLTYALWTHLLPIAWAKLSPDDRTLLTPNIEALLAKGNNSMTLLMLYCCAYLIIVVVG